MPQKILIVDDDLTILKVEEYNLEKAGYEVITAHDGEEALKKVQEEKPDLIILDVKMPLMDGYEVCQRIREDRLKSHIPIIMLTVKKDVEDTIKGLKTGANDYIIKPFNPQELLARVEGNLLRSRHDIQANPLTGLPGNISIMDNIEESIKAGKHFSVLYLDLDNFKPFNDTYGYERGDEVIKLTASIIIQVLKESGNPDDFIGHIGGDDFIVLTTPEKVNHICQNIIARFDDAILTFYDEKDKKAGYLLCQDRSGQLMRFPVISISIACVDTAQRKFSHPGEISAVAAEVKKYAKSIPGSIYCKDRRLESKLETTAKLENLSLIEDFIRQAARQFSLDKTRGFDVQVAVVEACENIIEHSYGEGREGPIEIRCELKDGDFVVRIKDKGEPFNPDAVPVPHIENNLEERTSGGLGIYLMKSLMDEVSYHFDAEKRNELVMVKKI